MLFAEIEGAVAIVASKGVYRQVKVYERKRRVYVQYGGGFIWVWRKGTSIPKVRVDDIQLPFEPEWDAHGNMLVPENYNHTKEENNERKTSKKNARRSA